MLDLYSIYARELAARERLSAEIWARQNVVMGSWSPWPGPFSTEHTPQIVEPLQRLSDPGPKEINLQGPAAGGKSTVGEVALCYIIDNEPGFTGWFAQDEDAAKEFAETRINRVLESCERVRARFPAGQGRHRKRTKAINFDHMDLVIQAANTGNANSKHLRGLLMDEPWMYDPGLQRALRKRTTRYAHNRLILTMSTGSAQGDETDKAWNRGSRQLWQGRCPLCERHHVPQWTFGRDKPGGVRWSRDAKRADGTWDEKAVLESTVYQCPLCEGDLAPSAANAYAFNAAGAYTRPVPDAMPRHYSFHWNCICSDFAQLGEIAVEYLEAKEAERHGTTVLLQEFNQKKLALAWSEQPPELAIGDEQSRTMGEPKADGEAFFMSVDCQDTHFWAVVRAARRGQGSRLVACARLETWDSVREFQTSHDVNDDCVVVDSGARADDVYTVCCKYGWIAVKGEKVPGGYRKKLKNGKTVVQIARVSANEAGVPYRYKPVKLLPESKAKFCRLLLVSDELTAEILGNARSGRVEGWTIAKDAPDFYREQLSSARRVSGRYPKTNQVYWFWKFIGKAGNHLWDCERYLFALMYIAGFFQIQPRKAEPQDEPAAA
jgi:hypothetical protein